MLCDVKLPDGNGVDLVGRIKAIAPDAEVILLTAYGNIPDGVQAIKNGAFDYITKGDDNPKIIPLLSRAMEKAKAQRKSAAGRQPETAPSFEAVIGSSKAMRDAVELARKVAATDTSVLPEPSPAPPKTKKDCSRRPTAARSSSTKSARCR